MGLRPLRPERSAYANSATSAPELHLAHGSMPADRRGLGDYIAPGRLRQRARQVVLLLARQARTLSNPDESNTVAFSGGSLPFAPGRTRTHNNASEARRDIHFTTGAV